MGRREPSRRNAGSFAVWRRFPLEYNVTCMAACSASCLQACSSSHMGPLNFGQWCCRIKEGTKHFQKLVRQFSRLRVANIPVHDVRDVSILDAPCTFACTKCDMCFSTFQKVALHQSSVVGWDEVEREDGPPRSSTIPAVQGLRRRLLGYARLSRQLPQPRRRRRRRRFHSLWPCSKHTARSLASAADHWWLQATHC